MTTASNDILLGAGLYETVRVEAGLIRFGEAHVARMQASAASLGLPVPSREAFIDAVRAAEPTAAAEVVRVVMFAGDSGEPVLTAGSRALASVEPVDAITLTGWFARGYALREHKLTSHFHGVWARRRAEAAGARDALLVERGSGYVGEASNANLISLLGDGRIATPPIDGLLPGVARGALLAALSEAGLPVRETFPTVADLVESAGVALTSTRGIVELRSLDGTPLPQWPAVDLGRLREALDLRARAGGIEVS